MCSISNDLDVTEDDILCDEQHDKSDTTPMNKVMTCMMMHEQIRQMFNEDSDDYEFLGFE